MNLICTKYWEGGWEGGHHGSGRDLHIKYSVEVLKQPVKHDRLTSDAPLSIILPSSHIVAA